MSRDIKFRVWDKTAGLWLAGWKIQQSGTPSEVSGVVYMQFTGLLDRNSVEIYECDILSSPDPELSELYVVTFDAKYGLTLDDQCSDHCDHGDSGTAYLCNTFPFYEFAPGGEVVGNIYENPKLLEEATNNGTR